MERRISLVVDDEPAIRGYIKLILERECFEAVEAGGGKEALEILEELGSQVELIVSDIHMPEGDGLSFARAAAEAFPELPIILVSGYTSAGEISDFEFLKKPFSPDSLLNTIRKVVTARAA
ncbi:MAG: response regulator [Acidobacteriia bacterium]|nr:response regulator [Terriglobia bacterium]MBV8906905.1 response regulator [Terriglobia bacterium]